MSTRREARELALQALYRVEVVGDESPEALELLWENFEAPIDARGFAVELLGGVLAGREAIDALIADAAENWSVARLSRVDLNVIRIAVFELQHRDPRTPTRVVLDEAIEIARRYGGEASSQFVNGVLDQIAGRLGVREPKPGDASAAGPPRSPGDDEES